MLPTDADSITTRDKVLRIAAALYIQHGYSSVSLRDIATEAGMRAGSLYYHFSSKEQLVSTVISLGLDGILEATQTELAQLRQPTPLKKFYTFLRVHSRTALQDGIFLRAFLKISNQLPPEMQQSCSSKIYEYNSILWGILREMEQNGDVKLPCKPSILGNFLLGALNYGMDWFGEGELTPDDLANLLADTVLHGIGPVRHPTD